MVKASPSWRQRGLRVGVVAMLPLALLLAGCLRQGVYHQVTSGQTLYRISKTYKVDEAYLARINAISSPTQLRVGTRIFIPGATSLKYVPATVSRHKSPVKNSSPTKKTAKRNAPIRVRSTDAPISKSSSAVKVATVKQASKRNPSQVNIKLHWPLRGKILRAFGQGGKGGGKGLEIGAREGSEVSAAAAGKVIYSGDGVQGFGHLMILQHENDVFTVYGFNSLNHVKQGQFVSKGQKIASSGRPPSGEAGRLHFEVRIGKLAVDPILYLP